MSLIFSTRKVCPANMMPDADLACAPWRGWVIPPAVWRNGSAIDSRSIGCRFDSCRGQSDFCRPPDRPTSRRGHPAPAAAAQQRPPVKLPAGACLLLLRRGLWPSRLDSCRGQSDFCRPPDRPTSRRGHPAPAAAAQQRPPVKLPAGACLLLLRRGLWPSRLDSCRGQSDFCRPPDRLTSRHGHPATAAAAQPIPPVQPPAVACPLLLLFFFVWV